MSLRALRGVAAAAAFATALNATAASAQLGIGVRAGTLGAGGELAIRPNRYLGFRVGGHYLAFSRGAVIDGIAYDMAPRLLSGTAIVDLHPFKGTFHVSGGVLWNSNESRVRAELAGPVTIGGQTYQPDDVGALSGVVRYPSRYVPYAGLGLSGRGRIALLVDLGVAFSGYPQVALTGSTNLTGPAKDVFDQNVQREIQDFQDEIDSRRYLRFFPVVSVGLRVGL